MSSFFVITLFVQNLYEIPWQDAGCQGDHYLASAPIPHARHFYRHWANMDTWQIWLC